MKPKITILYTTFLRDKLMYKSVQSIIDNWNKDYILLIANQSGINDQEKLENFTQFNLNINNPAHIPIYYYNLPYDCGLSYARNFLVNKAKEMNIDYCLLTADSITFTQSYDFSNIISFLEQDETRGLIGLNIIGRPSWERNINLIPGQYFELSINKETPIIYNGIEFKPCEICRNFFLAKTKCLDKIKWDDNFKLLEHEDFFYRLKINKWKVFYTDYIQAKYESYKPLEYNKMRQRMYNEFKLKLQEKYKIKGWVEYEKD